MSSIINVQSKTFRFSNGLTNAQIDAAYQVEIDALKNLGISNILSVVSFQKGGKIVVTFTYSSNNLE